MGKWDYEEVETDSTAFDDGIHTQVKRSFGTCDRTLDELPRLQKALEEMLEDISHVETIDSVFVLQRGSLRSKPRWDLELDIFGIRKMTKEEKAQYKEDEIEGIRWADRQDLNSLRRIKKEKPYLFDQL